MRAAVEQRRVPAHLEPVHADGQHPAAGRKLLGDGAHQAAEPGTLRLDGAYAGALQRTGRDRAHARRQHRPAEGGEHLVRPAALPGGPQHAGDRGRAGERDSVDEPLGDLVDQPAQRSGVVGRRPPVHRHLHHFGVGRPQGVDEVRQRLAVQLHRDAPAGQLPGVSVEQVGEHLGGRLRRRRPLAGQAGGPHRPAGLRAPREQPGPAQPLDQPFPQPPAVGRLQPAAEADAGGRDGDVQRAGDAGPGGRQQQRVVRERHDPDGRREHHPGAPALQQRGQLLAAPRRGDADGESGQRRGLRHGLDRAARVLRPRVTPVTPLLDRGDAGVPAADIEPARPARLPLRVERVDETPPCATRATTPTTCNPRRRRGRCATSSRLGFRVSADRIRSRLFDTDMPRMSTDVTRRD